jgi:hypothetical protein
MTAAFAPSFIQGGEREEGHIILVKRKAGMTRPFVEYYEAKHAFLGPQVIRRQS